MTYALCFGKPSCTRICKGVKYSLEIFIGVGFVRGGKVAITDHYYKFLDSKQFFMNYKNHQNSFINEESDK